MPFSYEDVKRMQAERRHRAATRRQAMEISRPTRATAPPLVEADVIELVFAEECEQREPLGA